MNVRRLLALATPLLVVAVGTPAYTYFSYAKAAHVGTSKAAAAAAKSPYALKADNGSGSAALTGMAGKLRTSSVEAILNQRDNLTGKWGGRCGSAPKVPAGSKVFCFNAADTRTREWSPQGVTGVADSGTAGKQGSGRPLLVGWHDDDEKLPHKSMRVTFVNTKNNSYQHVLLVWPRQDTKGQATYEPIGHDEAGGNGGSGGPGHSPHAGGIAWYGDRLYVADTGTGLRVFDMRRIYDLGKTRNGTTTHPERVGLHGKTYYGYGHRYVMPQVNAYVPARSAGASCTGDGTPSHSWLSINRAGEDKLVTGEWCPNDNGRVAQFPLGSRSKGSGSVTGDLVSDGNGEVVPSSVARLPTSYIQGGTTSNGTWWFTRDVPPAERQGELIQARWSGGFEEVKRQTISYGPEALSCPRGTGRIWTFTEHRGQRALYGMTRSEC